MVRTLPAGTPISSSRASRSGCLPAGEHALDELDEPLPVRHALSVGGQAGRGRVEVEPGAEPAPEPFAAHRDLDEAVGAVEQAVRGDRDVVVALGAARPRRPPSSGSTGRRARRPWRPAARCAPRCPCRSGRARPARPARRRRRTCRPAGRRSGVPTFCGSSGPEPVIDISPASPCAIWSYPARPPSGPSCPNPVMDRTTSRGFSSCSVANPRPSRSSTPVRKFSTSTSARRTSSSRTWRSSSAFRLRAMDSLLRLADRK